MTWAKAILLSATLGAATVGLRADGETELVMHSVYFTLKEPNRENIDKCLSAFKELSLIHI